MNYKYALLVAFGLLPMSVRTLVTPSSPVPAPTTHKTSAASETSHHKLDALMVKASAPNAKEADVEHALDAIFAASALDPKLAAAFSVRSRIVDAELGFHAHNHGAIKEETIAAALNSLVDRWDLPQYAHTSSLEVRKLHVAMLPFFPKYLTSDMPVRAKSQNGNGLVMVRTEMSPMEATLVFCLLIHQKLTWSEYQMTPAEFDAMMTARHTGKASPQLHDRTKEMGAAIKVAASHGSLRDLLAQADTTMNQLGITGGGL
jgi:hypothetical protein